MRSKIVDTQDKKIWTQRVSKRAGFLGSISNAMPLLCESLLLIKNYALSNFFYFTKDIEYVTRHQLRLLNYLVIVKTMARNVTDATYLMIRLERAFASCIAWERKRKK